jgi:hypothetical protein
MPPISSQLNLFSPLVQKAFLSQLGLNDRNGNGVIDKGAGEGYEEFTAKYGNADIGFFANGIIQGANNNKLEEPEIINHYYLNIRFKEPVETETIESEVSAYAYANNIPLVWLDDEQGTVMNAVSRILGTGWQEKNVSADEAEKMFQRVMGNMRVNGLTGDPSSTGYYQLPEFARRRSGYCFEVAQFGFWFFSQLKINSLVADTMLTPSVQHEVVKLTDKAKIIDYFGTSNPYNIQQNKWNITNPIQSIGNYYYAQSLSTGNITDHQKAVTYNKYDINTAALLMETYANSATPNHQEIINIGRFILENLQQDNGLNKIFRSDYAQANLVKNNVALVLCLLIESYSATKNRASFNNTASLINQYFNSNKDLQNYVQRYKF